MGRAIPAIALAAAVLVSGCAGGGHSTASSTPPAASAPQPPAKVVSYPLHTRLTRRGVTVALQRIVMRPNTPAELVMRVVNRTKNSGPDLEFDPYRVVVRQDGRRISTKNGPSFVLTTGGSAKGLTVQLLGFRPNLPYTVTAAVVASTDLKTVPVGWHRPLRFHYRFAPGSVSVF